MDHSRAALDASVVIPAHNEEAVITECLRELKAHMDGCAPGRWEVVVVNDGSSDGTLEQLKHAKADVPQLVIVCLDRNHGQTAAFDAGFKTARGRVVVTMDADMQNDPADIPRLLRLAGAWDVVCGVRARRQDSLTRRISSRVANATRNWLTGDNIRDVGCSLRAMKAECLVDLKLYHGMHRFLPTLLKWDGWRVTEIPVNHRPRTRGKAHYGIGNRLFRGLRDVFAVRWMKSRHIRYQISEVIR